MCSHVEIFTFRGETTGACLVRVETAHVLLDSRGNPRKLHKTHRHWLKTLIESTETTQNSLPLANDANRIHGNYSCTSQNLLIGPFIHEVIERLANGGVCCASYVVSLSFVRKTVLLSTSRRATRGVEQIKASSIDDGRRRRSHERAGRLDDNS